MVCVAVIISGRVNAAISCSTVISDLRPCLSYVTGSAAKPSDACCSGVRSLNDAATTTADRQTACGCFKTISGIVPGFSWDRAGKLAAQCGVNVGFPITPSVDCSTVT
ncbi:hypothetical protein SUGI_0999670 [Cryptomeria japonica]|nr:hypothetical protein SUGI_0999670 [Cryptomeria japonica]